MTPQPWLIVVLVVIGLLAQGCTTKKVALTFYSDPPGATLIHNGQNFGYMPITLDYVVKIHEIKKGVIRLMGAKSVWASGVWREIPEFHVKSKSRQAYYTFIRPDEYGGREKDVQFGLDFERLYAQRQAAQIEAQVQANLAEQARARAEAHENAQALTGLLLGIATGLGNSTPRTQSYQAPNAVQGALNGFNVGLQNAIQLQERSNAQAPARWLDEGGGDRRNARTGELELNIGKGGSFNTTTGELRHGAGGGDTFGSGGYRQDGQDERGNYLLDFNK